MRFKVEGAPIRLGGDGLLMRLTKSQANRRRHIIERVMDDGKAVSVLPRLMREPPELPDMGLYRMVGSCDFKAGELLEFPEAEAEKLGKDVLGRLRPADEAAAEVVGKATARPEKKPKPAHGGPAVFGPAVSKAPVSESSATSKPPDATQAASGIQSLSEAAKPAHGGKAGKR